ncbi:LuxR C-terminal-related transcriptional regulator [Lentzea sp. NPDC051838]|uniref:ATP-binding protein n=1 Tax=Lentzea sp. NPDC051838 TaxID=3154849 RepID=UPI003438FB46
MERDEVVGRAEEIGLFEHDLDLLRAGRGGAMAVTGEPGIGKTRLLAALGVAASEAGVITVRTSTELAEVRQASGAVVFVDDVHRLESDSASVLEELVRVARTRPLLLVLAYRPRQVDPVVGAVLSSAAASADLRHVRLGPLSLVETKELLAGHDDIERVHLEGSGNPLYLKLIAGQAAEPTGGLLAEFAGLGEAELRTAQAAAVLGGPFTLDVLSEVCTHDPATTRKAVDVLVTADLVRPGELVSLLEFRHPVVASVVYRHIPIGERWLLHSRVDEALARRDAPPGRRARHIAAAGLTGQVDVLLAAACEASDTDPAAALRWAGAAGALMSHGDPRTSDAQALEARARLVLGEVTQTYDGLRSAHAEGTASVLYAGRALELLGQYGEARALLRAAVPDDHSPDAAAVLSDLANLHTDAMDFVSAADCATTAVGIAQRHGDRLREAAALTEQAWARGCAGDIEFTRVVVGAAAALVDAMSDAVVMRDLRCLHQLALTELLVEDVVNTYRHLVRGVELCRRTGQLYIFSAMLELLGEVELRVGRVAEAVATLDEAVHQAGRDDLGPQQSIATGVRAYARYWQGGDVAEILADAETIEARCAGLRYGWAVFGRCMAGELIALAGDPQRGSRLLLKLGGGPDIPLVASRRQVRTWESLSGAAMTLGDTTSAAQYAELALRHPTTAWSASRRGLAQRARIRAIPGEPSELTAWASAAAAEFAAIDHWLDLAITEHLAGRAFLDAHRPDLAAAHLDRAADHATACGAGRLTALVAATRERLNQSPRPAWTSPLTSREIEVAELAAAGLTSAEIGRRLYLSTRTVDSHLGRVYRKVGVSNRIGLAQLIHAEGV